MASVSLHVLDLSTGKERAMPRIPTGVISDLKWHENNRDLAFSLNSAQSPADAYSVDVQTAKLERWTQSETGGLNPQNFVEPKLVKWKSFDGREISGWLYLPTDQAGSGQVSGDIVIHGGPEGQSRPIFLGRNNYFLNEMGVALIFPNVRGSTGYGKSFTQLDNGFLREGHLQGHRRPVRLDRRAAGAGCRADHGHRRQLRRTHDAGRGHALQRPASPARWTWSACRTW